MEYDIEVKYLILGAGLSGLSFAYFSKDNDYLIVEKDSNPGGYCRTIDNNDYVWDYAGHFFHFKNEKYKKIFESMVEKKEIIKKNKNTKIYYKGVMIDYPFQTNIHQLPKEEFIDCLYDLALKENNFCSKNFLAMLYSKFGKSITDKFLKPYNEKLYATDLNNLDSNAMGRFFPYADLQSTIKNMKGHSIKTYNDSFLYLKQGTGYFIKQLSKEIDSSKIRLNNSVIKIHTNKKIAVLKNGERIKYKKLINTSPFNDFLKLIEDKYYNELSRELSYNKVLVLNLGFDKINPDFKDYHWIYFPDKKLNFYRVGFYSSILNQDKMSIYVEIGFSKNSEIDKEAELKLAISGLKEVGIIKDGMNLVDKNIIIMDPAYVHISSKESKKIEEVRKKLEKDNIYNIGRYGVWTYNSMEDCMIMANELANKI